jgi:hypothetical protein
MMDRPLRVLRGEEAWRRGTSHSGTVRPGRTTSRRTSTPACSSWSGPMTRGSRSSRTRCSSRERGAPSTRAFRRPPRSWSRTSGPTLTSLRRSPSSNASGGSTRSGWTCVLSLGQRTVPATAVSRSCPCPTGPGLGEAWSPAAGGASMSWICRRVCPRAGDLDHRSGCGLRSNDRVGGARARVFRVPHARPMMALWRDVGRVEPG